MILILHCGTCGFEHLVSYIYKTPSERVHLGIYREVSGLCRAYILKKYYKNCVAQNQQG